MRFTSRKILSVLLASTLIASSLLLSGCTGRGKEKNNIEDLTDDGTIQTQTSTMGVTKVEELVSGSYYVLHNGTYYPLVYYVNNFEDAPGNSVKTSRQAYFTTANEIQIPTLFLGQEDKLVYYSTDTLLDYMVWERFEDLGYTIGVHELQQMTNGRYYLNVAEDEDECIIPDSELYSIYDLGVDFVLLDKIGGVDINDENGMVENGLIKGGVKSTEYDLEVYCGTLYKHFTTTFNIHAFQAMELFASVKYKTMQEYIYEIEIPSYFVDGYYYLNNGGMVRIVTGDRYSEMTEFNEPLLCPDPEKWEEGEDPLYIYSEFPALNKFTTTLEGKLGYVDPKAEEETKEEEETDAPVKVLKEASIKEVGLFCPADTQCIITIESPTKESTGDSFVKVGSKVYLLNYDRIKNQYQTSFAGRNNSAVLTVSGFFDAYEINLKGCYEYPEALQTETDNTKPTVTDVSSADVSTAPETDTTISK